MASEGSAARKVSAPENRGSCSKVAQSTENREEDDWKQNVRQ